jgi:hypothetical protein
MTPGEIAWRLRSAVRDRADRLWLKPRQKALPRAVLGNSNGEAVAFRVTAVPLAAWVNEAATEAASKQEHAWRERLLARADRIADHRLSFFDLEDRHLGDPIDWNRDHKSGTAAPMRFAPSIDYRDFAVTGDCKFVWEPNRHHHLVVLARAYRASGEQRYAEAVVEQLASWLDACPYGIGMNWRSPLELGVRLINWVWALDLIRESDLVAGGVRARVAGSVYRHAWEIDRKYSRGSSVNNHLVGEAAGAYVASAYFHSLKGSDRRRARAREILCREILSQTHADGGTREQALGYHLFVLQFFLLSGLVGRWSGEEFPPAYWQRLEKMFDFAAAMTEGGANLPLFGDCDDGYVLDLGDRRGDVRPWLAAAAVLFDQADFKALAGGFSETAYWLLGLAGRDRFDALAEPHPAPRLASRAFPDSGYYLLQCGTQGSDDRISVVFDCGELGMKPLAAHGHADALSFTLRAFGRDVFVDPGTYDYFSFPRWREYFRSTRAHNTVVLDGRDQSVIGGPFLWTRKAEARCLRWEPSDRGGTVAGEHDGYTRLADPAVHRRTLILDARERTLTIHDEIVARGEHDVALYFHLAEDAEVRSVGENRFEIAVGPGTVTLELDPRLSVDALRGSEDPIAGWVSRGYHHKAPSTTLVGRCESSGTLALNCVVNGKGGCLDKP